MWQSGPVSMNSSSRWQSTTKSSFTPRVLTNMRILCWICWTLTALFGHVSFVNPASITKETTSRTCLFWTVICLKQSLLITHPVHIFSTRKTLSIARLLSMTQLIESWTRLVPFWPVSRIPETCVELLRNGATGPTSRSTTNKTPSFRLYICLELSWLCTV